MSQEATPAGIDSDQAPGAPPAVSGDRVNRLLGDQDDIEGTASPRNLDRSFASSVAWAAIAKWSAQLATWAATIVLARLLTPNDYGILGMAAVFLGVVAILSEMGVGTSVLVLRDLTDEQIGQLNSLSLIMGLVGCAATIAAAVPLGHFFRSPELPKVLRVLSLTFLISGFRSVPLALLQRELRFRRIAALEATASVLAAASAVALAVAGGGYWALVLSQMVMVFTGTALLAWSRPQPIARLRWSVIGSATKFSNRVLVGRLSWYVYSNADFFVAGRMLGSVALGIYSFGWQLTSVALDRVATLINAVTPAYFSALQKDPAGLRRMLLGVTELLTMIIFPATTGIALVAPDLIPLVFGDKWLPSVPVIQLLAGYGLLRTMRPVLNNVLMNAGEARFLMWVGVGSAIAFPLAFLAAVPYGPTGIAAAWLLLYPVSMAVAYYRIFSIGIVTPRDYIHAVRPAIQATAVMALTVYAVRRWLLSDVSQPLRLAVAVVVGAMVYVAVFWVLHRDRIERLLRVVKGALGRKSP